MTANVPNARERTTKERADSTIAEKRYAVNMFNEGIRCSPFRITCRPPNHLANLATIKAIRNLLVPPKAEHPHPSD